MLSLHPKETKLHASVATCLHLCLVGLLCVEAETFPWTCSASSSCPLLGRSFTDGCDQQRLDSDSRVVHLGTHLTACLNEMDVWSCLLFFCAIVTKTKSNNKR